jgi:hypothetical protein
MSFPFLDLPPELRTKILLFLLHHATPITLERANRQTLPKTYPHNLLLSCAQLHTEALSLYYSSNTFNFVLQRHNERSLLYPFLSSPSRYLIRSLRVGIERWGANDYFVKQFAPAIEELILKGGLRRLQFVLPHRSGYALKPGKWITSEGDNWKCLKQLLRDPYLEFASLGVGAVGHPWSLGKWRDISHVIWE